MGATIQPKIPDNKRFVDMLSMLSQQYHGVEDAKRKTERAKFKVPFQRDFFKRPLRQKVWKRPLTKTATIHAFAFLCLLEEMEISFDNSLQRLLTNYLINPGRLTKTEGVKVIISVRLRLGYPKVFLLVIYLLLMETHSDRHWKMQKYLLWGREEICLFLFSQISALLKAC